MHKERKNHEKTDGALIVAKSATWLNIAMHLLMRIKIKNKLDFPFRMSNECYFCYKKHDFEKKCAERFLAMVQRVEHLAKPVKRLRQQTLEQAWAKKQRKGGVNLGNCIKN